MVSTSSYSDMVRKDVFTTKGAYCGKIADLDYYDAYTETPLDWLWKITTTKKNFLLNIMRRSP